MTISTTSTTITIDEAAGLQNATATPSPPFSAQDATDNDIAISALPSAFSSRLTALSVPATQAALSGYNGSAGSTGANIVSVTPDAGGTISSLGFFGPDGPDADTNPDPLKVYSGDVTQGVDSGHKTTSGSEIYLFADTTGSGGLGNNLVLGYYHDAVSNTDKVAFAIYLDQIKDVSGNITGAKVWTVITGPLQQDSATNTPEDLIDLTNKLFIAAQQKLLFDASNSPSGQNLFIMFDGTGGAQGVVATGMQPADQSSGASVSSGDTVNTSQAGGPTTFGTNAQMIQAPSSKDPNGNGLWFTFVTNPNPNFTTPNLDSTEAKTEADIQYGTFFGATEAAFDVVQLQSGKSAVVQITAVNSPHDGATDGGTNYVNNLLDDFNNLSARSVAITSVTLSGSNAGFLDPTHTSAGGVTATFSANGVTLSGILAGTHIDYTTNAPHERVLIRNAGSGTGNASAAFDIGGFQITSVSSSAVEVGSHIKFEDDGPTAALARSSITLSHDEGLFQSSGASDIASTSLSSSLNSQLTSVSNVSTDYQNDNPTNNFGQSSASVVDSTGTKSGADNVGATTVYSLSIAPGGQDTGLQTTSGTEIYLFLENGVAVGRIGSLQTGAAAFAVAIDPSTGVLGVAQYASLKHGTADTNTENHESLSINSGVLSAVVTETDGDGDQATASIDIGNALKILDDGPTAALALVSGATVAHDESPGVQGSPANDTTTPDATLKPLLTAVGTQASGTAQLALPSNTGPGGTDDRFAANKNILTNTGFSKGADEEGASTAYSLTLPGGDGSDSGVKATYAPGTAVLLYNESGVVVGRVGSQAGPAVFAIAIDPSTGEIDTEQYAALVQNTASNGDTSEAVSVKSGALNAVFTVTDGDGDVASKSVDIGQQIQFLDDGPTITASVTGEPTLTVSEATLGTSASGSFGVQFTPVYGADGPGSTPVSYAFSSPAAGTDSGLIDTATGQHVLLSGGGSEIDGTVTINNVATPVFTVSVDGSGNVLLTQKRAVVQGIGESPDQGEAVGLSGSNKVVLNAMATDGDGDQATSSLDLTSLLSFTDVGPTITVNNITNGTYAAGGSGTWSEAPNADGFKSLNMTLNNYTIDSHSQVTVNTSLGTDTTSDASGNYVFNGTINADFNGDGLSDTVKFTLTFNPKNNNYNINVTTPPTTVTTFDTSQGSLAAGGPDPVQTLTFSSGPSAGKNVVFFGAKPLAPTSGMSGGDALANPPQTPNDLEDLVYPGVTDLTKSQIDAFLTPTNKISSLIDSSTQMNVSTSGIGINNNNMDGDSTPGITSGDESFVVNPQLPVDTVTVQMDNSVGGYTPEAGEQLYYTPYYQSGSVGQPTLVTAPMLSPVTSGPAAGGRQFTVSDAGVLFNGQTDQIDAVQLTMASGKAKIPVIQFGIQQTFNPQPLTMNLTATLTDGDNDTKQSQFSIALA